VHMIGDSHVSLLQSGIRCNVSSRFGATQPIFSGGRQGRALCPNVVSW